MKESAIQKQILDWLKAEKYWVFKSIVANKSGIPDIIALKDGVMYGIEVKAKGKKSRVSELQQYHLDEIEEHCGVSFVADSIDDLIDMEL